MFLLPFVVPLFAAQVKTLCKHVGEIFSKGHKWVRKQVVLRMIQITVCIYQCHYWITQARQESRPAPLRGMP